MYFPHHKLEANQVINRLTCILSEGIIINTKNSIRISGIESDAVDIWDHRTKGAWPLLNDTQLYRDIGAFGEGPQV